jgi:predicted aspartyl protease
VHSEEIMGSETMGRVTLAAKVENLRDLFHVQDGLLPADQVRAIEVSDALVDTGATILSMPKKMIEQLGLRPVRSRKALASAGHVTVQLYGTARLTIAGRECSTDVSELPDDCPVLIGQVPLELLDFVVDPSGQRLIGNPAHGGEQMLEMY